MEAAAVAAKVRRQGGEGGAAGGGDDGGASAQWRRGWRDGSGVMEVARVAETTVMATRGNRGYEPTLEARVAEATVWR